MFYPEESLKRGGRFYLCWVADSWPLRFATITHRQLWSQDIRKICDDLMKVMINESGRPANRFSLRLSSQILRGLVRLYQKKVTVFLSELCMINANVIKHANKKWNVCEVALENVERPRLQVIEPLATIQEVPEAEHEDRRVEEIIANSGNVVSNIQDITLKEATIPEIQVPPNDGFGEEHPLYQSIVDRTLEVMLHAEGSVHSSALGAVLDSTDQSKSRLLHDPQMEMIAEHDLTMFRKSTAGEDLMAVGDFERDIPEIPIPDLPAPEISVSIPEVIEPVAGPSTEPIIETPRRPAPLPDDLEELEELEPQLKRRKPRTRLIIDRKIKLSSDYLRARIADNHVDLRCKTSFDAIIDIRVPPLEYLRRPCHGGARVSHIASDITRLFMRNLGIVPNKPLAEREIEEAIMDRPRPRIRSVLDKIDEVEEIIPQEAPQPMELQMEQPTELDISKDVPMVPRISAIERQDDISDLVTQKVLTVSQKRQAEESDVARSPKRPRLAGYSSFRKSQQIIVEAQIERTLPIAETNKENIPYDDNIPTQTRDTQRSVTAMLQEAGLADIQPYQDIEQPVASVGTNKTVRRAPSEGSETPLGSLDRTKVSLGESDQTTDSRRIIREQWGTEGTMLKILTCIRDGMKPLTIRNLITKGPVMSGYQRMIAAQSFTSILKLKHHGFIRVRKYADTLEIRDIVLGPKFD